jgi:hypothetical protein
LKSISKYLVNIKSNWERMYERQVDVVIHQDLSVVGNCKGGGHKGLGKNIEEYLWNLLVNQAIIWNEGLSGRK